ncbi:MAG TPA: GTPase ObgE [Vicinamibacterales bacterium]|nr:GTPase ObgE [Vicinamibacterales bacterium]
MFVDEVEIRVAAGDGGRGAVAFRREKFVPRGGPSGGDGGHGGSVYLVASPHLNTLVNFRFHPEFHARRGAHGEGSNRTGRDGPELEIQVPIGTVAHRLPLEGGTPELVADLDHEGARVLVARGGRGGRGNARFATSTNRAPRRAEPGEPGEAWRLQLQLKLLADAGLVGYPNAGKSTLISRISAARPKIADYPFTTLTPNLGVVRLSDDRSFVVADVPGLIEGAHRGAGLGHQFLRHVERTKVLVHVVDVSSASGRNPADDLAVIRRELDLFHAPLLDRPQVVAATKIDVLDDPARLESLQAAAAALDLPVVPVSGVTGQGIQKLLEALWQRVVARGGPLSAAVGAPEAGDEA